jgi:hypothetical protein
MLRRDKRPVKVSGQQMGAIQMHGAHRAVVRMVGGEAIYLVQGKGRLHPQPACQPYPEQSA